MDKSLLNIFPAFRDLPDKVKVKFPPGSAFPFYEKLRYATFLRQPDSNYLRARLPCSLSSLVLHSSFLPVNKKLLSLFTGGESDAVFEETQMDATSRALLEGRGGINVLQDPLLTVDVKPLTGEDEDVVVHTVDVKPGEDDDVVQKMDTSDVGGPCSSGGSLLVDYLETLGGGYGGHKGVLSTKDTKEVVLGRTTVVRPKVVVVVLVALLGEGMRKGRLLGMVGRSVVGDPSDVLRPRSSVGYFYSSSRGAAVDHPVLMGPTGLWSSFAVVWWNEVIYIRELSFRSVGTRRATIIVLDGI